MAKLLFSSQLTETEVQHCNTIINRHTLVTPACIVWKGTKDKDGYGETRLQFRGKRVKVRVHRLLFYIQTNCTDISKLHISHLCHNKACITFEHLSSEPARINNERKSCVLNGECSGHYGYKSCIL